jgi:glutathione S-transferase/alpha,alpha-trehalase
MYTCIIIARIVLSGRALDVLDKLVEGDKWLVNNEFSVADIAVGSYLNYVPVFFRNVSKLQRANLGKYMVRCASRPAFAKAFGDDHAELVIKKVPTWIGDAKPSGFKLF